jgi:hypothetical protein
MNKPRWVFLFSFLFVFFLGVLGPKFGLIISGGQLFALGLVSFVFLNIGMFTITNFPAIKSMVGKTEKEIEGIIVPALQGEMNMLNPRLVKYLGLIAVGSIGFALGGLGLVVLRLALHVA